MLNDIFVFKDVSLTHMMKLQLHLSQVNLKFILNMSCTQVEICSPGHKQEGERSVGSTQYLMTDTCSC